MTEPTLEPFDPRKFVKSLTSEQLEVLSEFYDEAAAALRILSRAGRTFQAPTGRDMLKVFQAAQPELLDRLAARFDDEDQLDEEPQQWRSGGRTGTRVPQSPESEWRGEIGYEIDKKRTGLPLPVIPTLEEVEELFEITKDHPRNHLIIRTLYSSGVRREELVNIRVADLYLSRNVIFIREGKYDKDRYVMIDEETSKLLDDYTRNFLLTDRVFDISKRTVNRVVNGAAEETGLRQRFLAMGHNFTPHSLRHCYATHMYERGIDTFALKTLLGHLLLKTTQTYVHVGIRALAQRYSNAHPLAQGFANPDQSDHDIDPLDYKDDLD